MIGWSYYFSRRPPGWKEDLRSFYQLKAAGAEKIEMTSIYPSLKPIFETPSSESPKVLGTQIHNFMLKAKGGKVLEGL